MIAPVPLSLFLSVGMLLCLPFLCMLILLLQPLLLLLSFSLFLSADTALTERRDVVAVVVITVYHGLVVVVVTSVCRHRVGGEINQWEVANVFGGGVADDIVVADVITVDVVAVYFACVVYVFVCAGAVTATSVTAVAVDVVVVVVVVISFVGFALIGRCDRRRWGCTTSSGPCLTPRRGWTRSERLRSLAACRPWVSLSAATKN